MNHTTFKFSSDTGLELFGRAWRSLVSTPKGIVHLVHGLGEHTGRYADVAAAFNEAGYHLVGFDLPGHGLSEGKRGHTPEFESLLNIIQEFIGISRQKLTENLPAFLYGHSLGGNLVINYGLRRETDLSGLITTSPSFALAFTPPKLKLRLGKVMANLMPSFTMNNALDVDKLSRDKAVVKAYQDDVLVHDRVSARLAMDILESGQYALNHAQEWELPLLLMHGTADGIASHEATQAFAEKRNDSIKLQLWEDYYHELHNDVGKEQVIKKMISWLDVQTGS